MSEQILYVTLGILIFLSIFKLKYFEGCEMGFGFGTQENVCNFGLNISWGGKRRCGGFNAHFNFINIKLILFGRRCMCAIDGEKKAKEEENERPTNPT